MLFEFAASIMVSCLTKFVIPGALGDHVIDTKIKMCK